VNISLHVNATPPGGDRHDPDTVQDKIDRHRDIMEGAGFRILGPAVLVPENAMFPGSYQVWWPIATAKADVYVWAFINTAGEPVYRPTLPTPEAMVR